MIRTTEVYGIVYRAQNLVSGKIYIGQTSKQLTQRVASHLNSVQKNSPYPFHKALRRYGELGFTWDVVSWAETRLELNDLEREWIRLSNSTDRHVGYNMTFGGEGFVGTPEARAKISASLSGRKQSKEMVARRVAGRAGYRHSEETKQKIGFANKGKPGTRNGAIVTEETREKMRAANVGKRHTEESRLKISASKKGIPWSNARREAQEQRRANRAAV